MDQPTILHLDGVGCDAAAVEALAGGQTVRRPDGTIVAPQHSRDGGFTVDLDACWVARALVLPDRLGLELNLLIYGLEGRTPDVTWSAR